MAICKHKGMSYHDANRCDVCIPYYQAHTRYDKDGDPYYDPAGGSSDGPESLIVTVFLFLIFLLYRWLA